MNRNTEHGRRLRCLSCALIFLFCSCFACSAFSAEKAGAIPQIDSLKSDSPLHIASDRMEVIQKDKTIIFEGHVTVQQDDLTITGSQMKVYGVEGKEGKKDKDKDKDNDPSMVNQIDRIEITGGVKITQKEKSATSDKAVYYHQEQKIVLIGNPVVSQGPDKVQGRLITLYIADGRSVVEGGEATPVQALLHPKKE